ncbi:hypothetical protein BH18ACT11_BH18ACT11_12230 [soil metagenome]
MTGEARERDRVAGKAGLRTAAWLAWSVCLLAVALTALGLLLMILNSSHPKLHVFDYWALLTVVTTAASPVGAVIASRRPQNPMGWIICALGLNGAVEHFASQYAIHALLANPGSSPGGEALAWLSSWFWVPGIGLLVFLLLLFPNGRLPSDRWRWFAWLSVAALTVGTISAAFVPGPIEWLRPIQNPLGIEGARGFLGPVASISEKLENGGLALVAAASLLLRLRSARGEERQQIKWFAYAATVVSGSLILTYTVSEAMDARWILRVGFGILVAGILGLPIAMGFAILKHRLYDIDLIINRTLVYGVLTVLLGLAYFGGVTAIQAIFQTVTGQEKLPQLAIVVSTLLIAALFNPLRRHIQSFIDRRFYRSKYDAAKTLDAFSATLREETDLGALSSELMGVVAETIQPAHVSLWLKEPRARA